MVRLWSELGSEMAQREDHVEEVVLNEAEQTAACGVVSVDEAALAVRCAPGWPLAGLLHRVGEG